MIFTAFVAFGGCFENDRSHHGDFHLVRILRPADEFIAAVQEKRAQDIGGKLGFAAMEIVFAQNKAKRLNGEEIAAAGIAQNMAPPSRLFDAVAPTTGDGSSSPRVHRQSHRRAPTAAARPESRSLPATIFALGQISAQSDFERAAIIRTAAGQKYPDAIHLLRQLPKNGTKAIRRGQPKIRRRELPLIDDAQTLRGAFHQDPRGLRSSSFDTEDSLGALHA